MELWLPGKEGLLRICLACSAEAVGCDGKSQTPWAFSNSTALGKHPVHSDHVMAFHSREKAGLCCSQSLFMWVWLWAWHMLPPQLRHHRFCCSWEFWTFSQKDSPRSSTDAWLPFHRFNKLPCFFFFNISSNRKLTQSNLAAWLHICRVGGISFFRVSWRFLSCNKQKLTSFYLFFFLSFWS